MAVSIDWGNKIINVPKADMALIQATPSEVRELDLDWFRLQLKALEDDEAGMPFPDTHTHNTEITLSGLTFARVVTIINGYTVEFEDGQYVVSCTGANHNLADVKVANQVSLIINNSAGLILGPESEQATPEEIRDAIYANIVEGNMTFIELQRIFLSVLAGLSSGSGTPDIGFRDLADLKNRVTALLDEAGNRIGVTLDGS